MRQRNALFLLLTSALVLAACASDELGPIANDRDAIHENCVETEPNAWQCDQGVDPQAREGSVIGTLADAPELEALAYGRVYDPPGCYYCGQHSGQGLYDWAPCPWGQTITRFHCVACNYYANYDRILYDCGTWARETEPAFEVTTVGVDGTLEVMNQE